MPSTSDEPDGRRPRPFRQFIVKLHSRCNLACDYCYIYTKVDQRWRSRPTTMSEDVVEHTVRRIAEHARRYDLAQVEVILHGGEPLLAGVDAIGAVMESLHRTVPARVRTTVQTNATLLDRSFLEVFRRLGVEVGVSLDGDRTANDRHRVRRDGCTSYPDVVRGLRLLVSDEFRQLFRGVLCTVDLANDPVTCYEALLEFAPPAVDFLLPHGNWSAPPPGWDPVSTPYADWLVAVFDRWYHAPSRETGVRMFEEIINVIFGGTSRVEGVGLSPTAMVIVETDGMIEQSDILATAFPGAAVTGLHVATDSFDAALHHPDLLVRQAGLAGLSAACRGCDQRTVCGGGLRAHRFRAGGGFDNPSVYCADLYRLVGHIRDRLASDLVGLRRGIG